MRQPHRLSYIHRIMILVLTVLLVSPDLQAQRGRIPVPVPQGAGNIIPDWVMYILFGGIALLIVAGALKWFVDRFRDFKSFTELLGLLFWVGGILLTYKITGWNFWWCLLAGFAIAALLVSFIEYIYKQAKTK